MTVVLFQSFRRSEALTEFIGRLNSEHCGNTGENRKNRSTSAVNKLRSRYSNLAPAEGLASIDGFDDPTVQLQIKDLVV